MPSKNSTTAIERHCPVCGKGRGVDHVVEFWQGGANTPDNLQNLCRSCNAKKSALLRLQQ